MAIDAIDQIEKFQEFLEVQYTAKINTAVSKGLRSISVDFFDLSKFDPDLAEQLLDEPEEVIKAAEMAIEQFDIGKPLRVRFFNFPESQKVFIRNIRSIHLSKFIAIEGIIRQASNVRPEVVSAKFECPSCGNTITLQQTENKFREPTRCTCGRKGKFRLLSKDLVDAQRLVVEESAQSLVGGAEPKRLSIFLREDLVEPYMEKKTTPGKNVVVTGVLKEVPIPARDGGISTRFEIVMNANHIDTVEEDFSDIEISEKDEKEIKELAKDKEIYSKLTKSVAPSIFGHDRIKEAIVLQQMGGVRKTKRDGTIIRGDIHMLLVGDPGAGKSAMLTFVKNTAPKARYVAGRSSSGAGLCVAPDSVVLTNPGGMSEIKNLVEKQLEGNKKSYCEGVWQAKDVGSGLKIYTLDDNLKLKGQKPAQFWKLKAPKEMVVIKTRSGKELCVTGNTKLMTMGESGVEWKKAGEFSEKDYVASARKMKEARSKVFLPGLIKSDPILYGIKRDVRKILGNVNKRELAKKLGFNENQLYHHWVNEKARGNMHLSQLKKLCKEFDYSLEKINYSEFSLYKGHRIKVPKYLNKDFLYFAGLVAGDGDLCHHGCAYCIRFSNSSEELMGKFESLAKKLFNARCNISSRASEKRPKSIRFGSKIVFELLNELGIPKSPKSKHLDLSNLLLNQDNEQIASFLRGLFDTDGCVVLRKMAGSNYISFSTASKNLAQKLQLVLLRYGILSKLRHRAASPNDKVNSKLDKYEIEIYGYDNLKRFEGNISFGHSTKRNKLRRVIEKISHSNTNVDVVPQVKGLLKRAIKANILNGTNLLTRRSNISNNYFNNFMKNLSSVDVKEKDAFEKLLSLSDSDVFWDEIKEIKFEKDHGFDYVYDLTVEDSHNFLVNGFVVHNTAAVVKDEFLKGWALEAGAIVLADKGILVIDEMDKMTKEDTSALHEGLEQQQITIAKANIQATLRAQTTVLAAANPKLGRFDPFAPIAAQIDLPPALINRFDLIFVVRDIPDREKDAKIAQHVLMHQAFKGEAAIIAPEVFRKYIAYVKQRVFPVLTDEAMEDIKRFYVNLRNAGSTGGEAIKPIPISARQLEAIVRLAEGSARIRLSDKVDRQDVAKAINLLKACLSEVGVDPETGQMDIDRIGSGITASERGKIVVVRNIIYKLDEMGKKTISIDEIVEEAAKKGIAEHKVDEAIEKLRRSGDIFQPKPNFIQKI